MIYFVILFFLLILTVRYDINGKEEYRADNRGKPQRRLPLPLWRRRDNPFAGHPDGKEPRVRQPLRHGQPHRPRT